LTQFFHDLSASARKVQVGSHRKDGFPYC